MPSGPSAAFSQAGTYEVGVRRARAPGGPESTEARPARWLPRSSAGRAEAWERQHQRVLPVLRAKPRAREEATRARGGPPGCRQHRAGDREEKEVRLGTHEDVAHTQLPQNERRDPCCTEGQDSVLPVGSRDCWDQRQCGRLSAPGPRGRLPAAPWVRASCPLGGWNLYSSPLRTRRIDLILSDKWQAGSAHRGNRGRERRSCVTGKPEAWVVL